MIFKFIIYIHLIIYYFIINNNKGTSSTFDYVGCTSSSTFYDSPLSGRCFTPSDTSSVCCTSSTCSCPSTTSSTYTCGTFPIASSPGNQIYPQSYMINAGTGVIGGSTKASTNILIIYLHSYHGWTLMLLQEKQILIQYLILQIQIWIA